MFPVEIIVSHDCNILVGRGWYSMSKFDQLNVADDEESQGGRSLTTICLFLLIPIFIYIFLRPIFTDGS